MPTASRIVKAKYAATAFDGEGARRQGGRWNSPGHAMVYTADSAALAALEMLVHLGRGTVLQHYVRIECSFATRLVSDLDRSRLPSNWRSYPAPPELQVLGDEWIRKAATPVLRVPSVIIESEFNFLLNPSHREFGAIEFGEPIPFEFDLRLL